MGDKTSRGLGHCGAPRPLGGKAPLPNLLNMTSRFAQARPPPGWFLCVGFATLQAETCEFEIATGRNAESARAK